MTGTQDKRVLYGVINFSQVYSYSSIFESKA